ncbi:Ca2+ regulator and membrane fusion protein Fig1-domain-containing protein [Scheffersomyces xylosifermentans]|uniref:Ca2+ regulator and membrane fusion protein Fig1-domain-containing protein n=1 Tax=Scheffersomyces xylosifermentans TaxID=1304137 RepID=UPI00315CC235
MLFFILKKVIKLFPVVLLFINGFLLSFLLIGCVDTSKQYSNVYLIKLEYNQTSPLFANVNAAYKSANSSTELATMSITIGYMGVCVKVSENLSCTTFKSLDTFSNVSGVSIIPTKAKVMTPQLDLVKLAKSFNKICHPRILMAAIIMDLVLLVILCYCSIPLMPGKPALHICASALAFCNSLLWGLGAMLQQESVFTTSKIVGDSAMGVISATIGTRASAISWVAFTFQLVVTIACVVDVFQDIGAKQNKIGQKC